jgi:hypothetical protein
MYVMHKDSVHTSRRTQSASIRNNTPLMVSTEMITAYCQNYTKDMNIQFGQNTQFSILNLAVKILITVLSRVNGNSKLSKEDLATYSY